MLDLIPYTDKNKFENVYHYEKKISEIAKEINQGRSNINRWIFKK